MLEVSFVVWKFKKVFFVCLFTFILWVKACVVVKVWSSEDILWEPNLPFHHVGAGSQGSVQVVDH